MATAITEIQKIIREKKGLPEIVLKSEMQGVVIEDGDFEVEYYENGDIHISTRPIESPIKFNENTYEKWKKIAEENGYLLKPFLHAFELQKENGRIFKKTKTIAKLYDHFFSVSLDIDPQIIEDIGRKFYGLRTAKEMES